MTEAEIKWVSWAEGVFRALLLAGFAGAGMLIALVSWHKGAATNLDYTLSLVTSGAILFFATPFLQKTSF